MSGKSFKTIWVLTAILGLGYTLWVVAIFVSLVPLPQGLLWFLETYASHDGQITDLQAAWRKIMVVPGVILIVFMLGLQTLRAFSFSGYLLAAYALFIILHYSFYRWYVTVVLENGQFEDSLLEWGGFVCAFSAGVLFFISARRGIGAAYFLAVAFFLFAMEEISWGERVFGFYGPEIITDHNLQSETNLHNFISQDYFTVIYFSVNMLAFVALTWARRVRVLSGLFSLGNLGRVFSVSDRLGIWVVFLLLSLASIFPGEEFVEEQWSLLGLFLAVMLLRVPALKRAGHIDI